MSKRSYWESHIQSWQASGLPQTVYCRRQGLNYKSFTVRLSHYRKWAISDLPALIQVRFQPASPAALMRLTHDKGFHVDLPAQTSAAWLAELLRCLG